MFTVTRAPINDKSCVATPSTNRTSLGEFDFTIHNDVTVTVTRDRDTSRHKDRMSRQFPVIAVQDVCHRVSGVMWKQVPKCGLSIYMCASEF